MMPYKKMVCDDDCYDDLTSARIQLRFCKVDKESGICVMCQLCIKRLHRSAYIGATFR